MEEAVSIRRSPGESAESVEANEVDGAVTAQELVAEAPPAGDKASTEIVAAAEAAAERAGDGADFIRLASPESSDEPGALVGQKRGFYIADAPEPAAAAAAAQAPALAPRMLSEVPGIGDLDHVNESDAVHFALLLKGDSAGGDAVPGQAAALRLLLRIKNGTPAVRKVAMRQITQDARALGAPAVLPSVLPILADLGLDEHERHLMVKVLGRVLFQLGPAVGPFAGRVLEVIQPLLHTADPVMRSEGRELVAALARAVGLKQMLLLVRPELDAADDAARRATALVIAVLARAVGVHTLVPFLNAVVRSQASWHIRHTGLRAVQQLALLSGSSVLPHLDHLVAMAAHCLRDGQFKVRIAACNALAALAEAANPYGIEAFEPAMEALWSGVRRHRGRALAAFIRAIGALVPLLDPDSLAFYTRRVLDVALKEAASSDEDMKRTVLQVVALCAESDGVDRTYFEDKVLPDFFPNFWLRRLAMDKRSARLVTQATVSLAARVGAAPVLQYLVDMSVLKDAAADFQHMGLETLRRVAEEQQLLGMPARLEELLVDHLVQAVQHSRAYDGMMLSALATLLRTMGPRAAPYLDQVVDAALGLLNTPNPDVRQLAALLLGELAPAVKLNGRTELLVKIGTVLNEQLGDESPQTLAAILTGLLGVVTVVGLATMQPPVRDLLPRLTPILRNNSERVQEASIQLVGKIAERGAEYVGAREWIRICFELLELFKSPRKSVRRRANDAFGHIAQGIGPQDVVVTLLNNLKGQDRQSRVSTAVALGIVAKECEPFTVLPALLNEYQAPDLNVQQGVLKALAFMFEYIGETSSDYLESSVTLVDHALGHWSAVHRQTAASIAKHLALGAAGHDEEEVFVHFTNELLPSVFETSPHVISRVLDAASALRGATGFGAALNYVWAGLFHPARKVRDVYWKMFNDAYVQNGDAVVPYYPDAVPELNLWI